MPNRNMYLSDELVKRMNECEDKLPPGLKVNWSQACQEGVLQMIEKLEIIIEEMEKKT